MKSNRANLLKLLETSGEHLEGFGVLEGGMWDDYIQRVLSTVAQWKWGRRRQKGNRTLGGVTIGCVTIFIWFVFPLLPLLPVLSLSAFVCRLSKMLADSDCLVARQHLPCSIKRNLLRTGHCLLRRLYFSLGFYCFSRVPPAFLECLFFCLLCVCETVRLRLQRLADEQRLQSGGAAAAASIYQSRAP